MPIYMILSKGPQELAVGKWAHGSKSLENIYRDYIIPVCILCEHQFGRTNLRCICPTFDDRDICRSQQDINSICFLY